MCAFRPVGGGGRTINNHVHHPAPAISKALSSTFGPRVLYTSIKLAFTRNKIQRENTYSSMYGIRRLNCAGARSHPCPTVTSYGMFTTSPGRDRLRLTVCSRILRTGRRRASERHETERAKSKTGDYKHEYEVTTCICIPGTK